MPRRVSLKEKETVALLRQDPTAHGTKLGKDANRLPGLGCQDVANSRSPDQGDIRKHLMIMQVL